MRTLGRWNGMLVGVVLACSASIHAGEPITISHRVVNQPEMGEVTWQDVQSPAGNFTFIPPAGWRLQQAPREGVMRLASPDYLVQIEIEFSSRPAPVASASQIETVRKRLESTYLGAALLEDFVCHAGGRAGRAFDLRWKHSPGVEMAARVVVVAFAGGTVEFRLVSSPDALKAYHQLFSALLTSFTSKPPVEFKSETAASR
jgi:hypothetical protein